jgi:hypothetical protein
MNKRHAKPTAQQLANRTYRKYIDMQHDIKTLMSGQRMLSERMESFRILADHCARLLKEKETLMTQRANDSMTFPQRATLPHELLVEGGPYPAPTCSVISLHRTGVRCAVCGVTP